MLVLDTLFWRVEGTIVGQFYHATSVAAVRRIGCPSQPVRCRNSSRRQDVLVHQTAKTITALDTTSERAWRRRAHRRRGLRGPEIQSAMWPVRVVMIDEGPDGAFKMLLVQEHQSVEALRPHRPSDSCSATVIRSSRASFDEVFRTEGIEIVRTGGFEPPAATMESVSCRF